MGDNVLPEESLKYYLEHSKAFLGEKNVRYDVYSKGMPVMTKSGEGRTNIPETTVQRSYFFDYALLREWHDYPRNIYNKCNIKNVKYLQITLRVTSRNIKVSVSAITHCRFK